MFGENRCQGGSAWLLFRYTPTSGSERGDMYDWRPRLTVKRVLEWADARYRVQTVRHAAVIAGVKTWKAINHSLHLGTRRLAAGSSLAKLKKHWRQ